jgi:hypothetical protein
VHLFEVTLQCVQIFPPKFADHFLIGDP